jgi:hypothetical protein
MSFETSLFYSVHSFYEYVCKMSSLNLRAISGSSLPLGHGGLTFLDKPFSKQTFKMWFQNLWELCNKLTITNQVNAKDTRWIFLTETVLHMVEILRHQNNWLIQSIILILTLYGSLLNVTLLNIFAFFLSFSASSMSNTVYWLPLNRKFS